MPKLKHLDIENTVCRMFNIDNNRLYERTRKHEVCYPRQVVMYFCLTIGGMTTTKTASFYGLKHCSAVHAKKVIENYKDVDRYENERIMTIYRMLQDKKETPDIVLQEVDLLKMTLNYTNSTLKTS